MFGPACADTHKTSSIVHPLLQVRSELIDCGQPSAEPKFHKREFVVRTYPSTHARAWPGGPQPGSKSTEPDTTVRGSDSACAAATSFAHAIPPM